MMKKVKNLSQYIGSFNQEVFKNQDFQEQRKTFKTKRKIKCKTKNKKSEWQKQQVYNLGAN